MAIAIKTRKNSNIINTLELLISSEIKIWKENVGWTGPYTFFGKTNENMIYSVNINGRFTDFRTTSVKLYHRNNDESDPNYPRISDHDNLQPRPQKRPKESKNKPRNNPTDPPRRNPPRNTRPHEIYVSKKKVANLALALQLQKKGKITTPDEPFEQSD
jgi:hypothetical protein